MAFVATTQASRLARAGLEPGGQCFLRRPVSNPPQWAAAGEERSPAACIRDPECAGLVVAAGSPPRRLTGDPPVPYRDDDRPHPRYAFWERAPCGFPGAVRWPAGTPRPSAAPKPPPKGAIAGGVYSLSESLRFVKGTAAASWAYDGAALRGPSGACLAGRDGALELRPCDPRDPAMRWTNEGGRLCLAGACLYASGNRPLREEPPEFNPAVGWRPEEPSRQAPQAPPALQGTDPHGGAVSPALYQQQPFLNPFAPMSRKRRLV